MSDASVLVDPDVTRDKAARLGVEADDVVNTMSADDLVAWTAAHPTA